MSTIDRRAILAAVPAVLVSTSPLAALERTADAPESLWPETFVEFVTTEPPRRLIMLAEMIEAHGSENLRRLAVHIRQVAKERATGEGKAALVSMWPDTEAGPAQ